MFLELLLLRPDEQKIEDREDEDEGQEKAEVEAGGGASGGLGSLGKREMQVLQLLAEGNRSSSIAEKLSISVATVDTHRRNIMRKLDLHTVAELTKFAIREGLTLS